MVQELSNEASSVSAKGRIPIHEKFNFVRMPQNWDARPKIQKRTRSSGSLASMNL